MGSGAGLAVLILSPSPAPPHCPVARLELAKQDGWGRGGRPAPVKGRELGIASLMFSTGLSPLRPQVWARGHGEEASGWGTSGHVLAQPLDSSGLEKGHSILWCWNFPVRVGRYLTLA